MPVPTHERKLSCRKPNIVVHLAHVTCNSIFENKKAPVCMSNTYTEATCFSYKSSAEAEMGDSLATIDMGEKRGCCAPFGRGVGSPSNTMWTGSRSTFVYKVASWSIQPFGHNRHGPKSGVLCPFLGELDPRLTQCRRTKWHLDPSSRLAATDMGRKLGALPLWRELGPYLTQSRLG